MPHKFKVYAENSTNIYNDSEYDASNERINGSQPATPVVSKLMNTALKSVSMVTEAFMNVVTQTQVDDVGVQSAQSTIVDYITQGLISFIDTNVGYSFSSTENSTNGDTLNLKVGSTTKNVTVKNSANARTAYNVSTQINGKNITSIFEVDGTTARQATKDSRGQNIDSTYIMSISLQNYNNLVITKGNTTFTTISLPKSILYITENAGATIDVSDITSGATFKLIKRATVTTTYADFSSNVSNSYTNRQRIYTLMPKLVERVCVDVGYVSQLIVHQQCSLKSNGVYNNISIFGENISCVSEDAGHYFGIAYVQPQARVAMYFIYACRTSNPTPVVVRSGIKELLNLRDDNNNSYIALNVCSGRNDNYSIVTHIDIISAISL